MIPHKRHSGSAIALFLTTKPTIVVALRSMRALCFGRLEMVGKVLPVQTCAPVWKRIHLKRRETLLQPRKKERNRRIQ